MSDDDGGGEFRIDGVCAWGCGCLIVFIVKANWSAREAVGELVRLAGSFFPP